MHGSRPTFKIRAVASGLIAVALGGVVACQDHPTQATGKHPAAASPRVSATPPAQVSSTHVPVGVPSPTTASNEIKATATPAPLTPPIPSVVPTTDPVVLETSAFLAGRVAGPAAIVANNGAGLISDQGGAVISNNGGRLISDQGGGIVGNHGAGYRTLATGDVGLPNAFLYLTNRDEKFYLDALTHQAFTLATDPDGGYGFKITTSNGFPVDKDVIVNALLNENQRLTGFTVPSIGKNTLNVTLGTTLCTELLRAEAARQGKSLKAFDPVAVARAVDQTEAALVAGDLPTIVQSTGPNGQTSKSAAFDLRLEHLDRLRSQYVLAFSAVGVGSSALHALSDTWKTLFGYRPTAITTVYGNGEVPTLATSVTTSGDGPPADPLQVPVGYCGGIAVAPRGDIFITTYGNQTGDGRVRWFEPGGRVATVSMPQFPFDQAGGIAVEADPVSDPTASQGSVLVAGDTASFVTRYATVEAANQIGFLPGGKATIVAGEVTPLGGDPEHPAMVDATSIGIDTTKARTSRWRLGDEGERSYVSTGQPVPQPARFAALNKPSDVALDELGNIYIADTWNQRIRMIPKSDGAYFGYRQPLDDDGDGVVDRFGAAPPMKAGCIYTIAGNPPWDTTRTPDHGGHWFGDYAGDGGLAQQAQLSTPTSLTFFEGHLYVADSDNQRIRRISRDTGIIDTLAGSPPGTQQQNGTYYFYPGGTAGDGGPAAKAQLYGPRALATDLKGCLYFFDAGSQRIRMIDLHAQGNPIVTVAGHLSDPFGGFGALSSDGEALFGVALTDIRGLAVDAQRNLLMTDFANRRVRKLWRQWE